MAKIKYYDKNTSKWEYADTGGEGAYSNKGFELLAEYEVVDDNVAEIEFTQEKYPNILNHKQLLIGVVCPNGLERDYNIRLFLPTEISRGAQINLVYAGSKNKKASVMFVDGSTGVAIPYSGTQQEKDWVMQLVISSVMSGNLSKKFLSYPIDYTKILLTCPAFEKGTKIRIEGRL